MSEKKVDGAHHKKRRKLHRLLFAGFLMFIILVLLAILIVWLVLRPTKPRFTLQDVTVYALNVSSPNYLTSNFQVTVSSRNPNNKIGVYYHEMHIYATYLNQQVTVSTSLPTTYQGHKDINIWSPYIYGQSVPVAPYLAVALYQDQQAGVLLIDVKIDGRIKWKVGTWMSGKYHLHVTCPAYITFGSRNTGLPVGANAMKYRLLQECNVDV